MRFNHPHSRRTFVAGTAALATLPLVDAHAQSESTPEHIENLPASAGLGATKEEWNAAAGSPEPVDDLFLYTISPPVTVGFTDGVATFLEFGLDDNGLSREEAYQLIADNLPGDAMPGERFTTRALSEGLGPQAVSLYALPSEHPSGGAIALMGLESPESDAAVTSIAIVATSDPDVEIPVTGDPGGVALDRDAWIAAKGEPAEVDYEEEQYPAVGPQEMDVTVFYAPQDDVIAHLHANGDQLDMLASTQIAALEFLGQSVPADSQMLLHGYLPATKAGPLAVRCVTFASEEASTKLHFKGSILGLLFERPDDPKPMVTRIDIGVPDRDQPN